MIMALVDTIVQCGHEPMEISNIMPSGSITLEQVAARTAALAVACTRCLGSRRLDHLAKRYDMTPAGRPSYGSGMRRKARSSSLDGRA